MTKQFVFLFVVLLTLSIISASCDEGQVNINTASATALELFNGIGPVKADAIISTRPFDSIDNLIDVSGIGDATLTKIKVQGLACVDDIQEEVGTTRVSPEEPLTEIPTGGKETEENIKVINNKSEVNDIKELLVNNSLNNKPEILLETIKLNPKDIKTDSDMESSDKNIGLYGFVLFCVLLGVLFIFKKKRYKTEFEP